MINWAQELPAIKPKYLAIIQLIKSLIQNNQLLPGQRLPAERSLARWFNVDRSTVSRAFDELTAQGLLYKRRGSGAFVADTSQLKTLVSINWQSLLKSVESTSSAIEEKLTQARFLDKGELIDGAANELPADLIPDLGTFEFDWNNYLTAQKTNHPNGDPDLIKTLSYQQEIQQKIDFSRQTALISGGAEQSLLLILSSLLSPGDSIAFANPSYFHSTAVFQTLGINRYSVPLISSNFDLDQLEEIILKHRIKLLLLNPTLENPTGENLTMHQRQSVLKLCQQYQIPIVEDDVFGWLVNDKKSLPTLKTLSPDNVIYISSLSKLLGSNTRIGWIIAPQAIGQRLLRVQKQLDMAPSMLAQRLVNNALTSSKFTLGLVQLTHTLENRRNAVIKIFHKFCPKWQFSIPSGGFYLWISQTDPNIFENLLAEQILVKPGTIYGASKYEFRLNIARMDQSKRAILAEKLQKLKR